MSDEFKKDNSDTTTTTQQEETAKNIIINKTNTKENNGTPVVLPNNIVVKNIELSTAKKQVFTNNITENINILRNILLLDLILALLTTFFFSFSNVAYSGFPIYTVIVSVMLYVFLKNNNLIATKSGFIWLIPINLIALSNAIFYTNTHVFNILIVHLFFGIMLIKVTNSNFSKVYDVSLLRRLLNNFVPNFTFTGITINKIFFKKVKNEELVKKSSSTLISILIGIIVALPVLFIVLILLGGADENFRNIVQQFLSFEPKSFDFGYKLIYFVFAFLIFMFYSTKIFYTKDFFPKETKKLKINSVTASTFLILLNIVYVLFLYLQAQYIFTDGLFALPSDFTYSEYARDGFFPTFAVTIINLCLITFIIHFTTLDFSSKVYKLNFIVMFTSNVLLIFNALNRMYLYINTYGYTSLRTLPTLALFLILMLMLLLALYILKNVNFYKYALLSFVVFYVVQAYTCNDIVSTSLNFNKFNVSFDDLTLNESNEFIIVTSDGHVLDFEENIDTYWYYSKINPSYVSKIPMRHYADRAIQNYYSSNYDDYADEDTYRVVYEKVPFYSKTILQLVLENLWYN